MLVLPLLGCCLILSLEELGVDLGGCCWPFWHVSAWHEHVAVVKNVWVELTSALLNARVAGCAALSFFTLSFNLFKRRHILERLVDRWASASQLEALIHGMAVTTVCNYDSPGS